jgi:hypothetical protein
MKPFGVVLSDSHSILQFFLFTELQNQAAHIQDTRDLIEHLKLSHPNGKSLIKILDDHRFLSSLSGFHDAVTVWQLASLHGEEFLWDSVVNAGLEYLYALARLSFGTTSPPYVILSTFLLDEVLQTFRANHEYGERLDALRDRISQPTVLGVAFIVTAEAHYTPYMYNKTDGSLITCDSAGKEPDEEMIGALSWLLKGLHLRLPSRIYSVTGPLQGPDSGSCGIAALNYLECRMFPKAELWDGDGSSPRFRNRLIEIILRWHKLSSGTEVS